MCVPDCLGQKGWLTAHVRGLSTTIYPMPRVDDMIDALGKAKFITTWTSVVVTGRFLCQRNHDLLHPSPPVLTVPVPCDALWSTGSPGYVTADDGLF